MPAPPPEGRSAPLSAPLSDPLSAPLSRHNVLAGGPRWPDVGMILS